MTSKDQQALELNLIKYHLIQWHKQIKLKLDSYLQRPSSPYL